MRQRSGNRCWPREISCDSGRRKALRGRSSDRALRPFWPILWRLAARGHYFLKQEPLRLPSTAKDSFYQPPIPSVKEGEYSLSFARGEGGDVLPASELPRPSRPAVSDQRISQDHGVPRDARDVGARRSERRWNASTSSDTSRHPRRARGRTCGFVPTRTALRSASRRKSGSRCRRCFAAPGKSPRYAWRGMNWRSNTVNFDAALLRSGSFADTPPQIGCCKAPRGALG